MDVHFHLAADPHGQAGEHLQRVGDPPVGRVLDRHQAEVGVPLIDFLEDGRDGSHGQKLDDRPKRCRAARWL